MRWGSGEGGQATVEWVGLMLAAALALGALAASVRGATDEEAATEDLGETLAQRITCTAGAGCEADGAGRAESGAPGGQGALRGSPARRQPVRAWRGRAPGAAGTSTPGAGALSRLGKAGAAVRRAWVVCFGYRSWRNEVEHPRSPREAAPVDETLGILNDCLNPWQFFFG